MSTSYVIPKSNTSSEYEIRKDYDALAHNIGLTREELASLQALGYADKIGLLVFLKKFYSGKWKGVPVGSASIPRDVDIASAAGSLAKRFRECIPIEGGVKIFPKDKGKFRFMIRCIVIPELDENIVRRFVPEFLGDVLVVVFLEKYETTSIWMKLCTAWMKLYTANLCVSYTIM